MNKYFTEDPRTKLVKYVVCATFEEQQALWREHSEEAAKSKWGSPGNIRVPWIQDNSGWGVNLDDRMMMTVSYVRIYGQMVLFYDGASMLIDYGKMRKYLSSVIPDFTDMHTNAANFHICLHALRDMYCEANGLSTHFTHSWVNHGTHWACRLCPVTKMTLSGIPSP